MNPPINSPLVRIIESVGKHSEPDGQYDDSGHNADDADGVADSHHGPGQVGG
ncbi:hypothetical protein DPMN_059992 [Dreissena polymorpha]|uniref:Uncharacterized protein n=1 Tax=Dreissena polymorpha TaxID=45954 RepID=A0A9D4C4Z2_DREPO|nr:hypothetical protein DPMN_059992 [Dreissena polymorpha]